MQRGVVEEAAVHRLPQRRRHRLEVVDGRGEEAPRAWGAELEDEPVAVPAAARRPLRQLRHRVRAQQELGAAVEEDQLVRSHAEETAQLRREEGVEGWQPTRGGGG